jgi:hypothetical protein
MKNRLAIFTFGKPLKSISTLQQLINEVTRRGMLGPAEQCHEIRVPKLTQHLYLLLEASILYALASGH